MSYEEKTKPFWAAPVGACLQAKLHRRSGRSTAKGPPPQHIAVEPPLLQKASSTAPVGAQLVERTAEGGGPKGQEKQGEARFLPFLEACSLRLVAHGS